MTTNQTYITKSYRDEGQWWYNVLSTTDELLGLGAGVKPEYTALWRDAVPVWAPYAETPMFRYYPSKAEAEQALKRYLYETR